MKAFTVLLLWQHTRLGTCSQSSRSPVHQLGQQNNLELSSQKCPQTQTAHHTQIKHPTTDIQSCEQSKLTTCAVTLATGTCGAPSTLCFADPTGLYRQTTHTSQKPSSSLITFATQGLLVLSRLAQCTVVTLQHFPRSWGPQLHPKVTLP